MNANEGSNDVRLAATRSLYNAFGFAQANFSNDMELSIASTYYDKLAPYIQDIFNITTKSVKEDEESVAYV
ncbi:hypothetical protein LIER_43559 [Lithospermum erythrorhizon]|uniref:Uncharacterized protein n=1 Tax=Lithospermum erythrorhizon TaxID=34254 RepID=A0AAV3QDJ2_LITER